MREQIQNDPIEPLVNKHVVEGSCNRQIAYQVSGDPEGKPVFLLHGTPGSRIGPNPRAVELYRQGIRLITYDRPGYGESDPFPGRRVVDAADDVRAIADDLGLDTFGVVGRSGGSPHALACAALLRDRVRRVVAMCGMSPPGSEPLDDGNMIDRNVRAFEAQSSDRRSLQSVMEMAQPLRKDPSSLIDGFIQRGEASPSDMRVLGNIAMRQLIEQSYSEALRQGPGGWIDDVKALRSPWGFALRDVVYPTEVHVWHGGRDRFTPPRHAERIAKMLNRQTRLSYEEDNAWMKEVVDAASQHPACSAAARRPLTVPKALHIVHGVFSEHPELLYKGDKLAKTAAEQVVCLGSKPPKVSVRIDPGLSHFNALEVAVPYLGWAAGGPEPEFVD